MDPDVTDRATSPDPADLDPASPLIERDPAEVIPHVVSLDRVSPCNDVVIEAGPPLTFVLPRQPWAYGALFSLDHAALGADARGPLIVVLDLDVESGPVGIMGLGEGLERPTTPETVVGPGHTTLRLTLDAPADTSAIVLRNAAGTGAPPRVTVAALGAYRPGRPRLARRTHDLGFDLFVVLSPDGTASRTVEQILLELAPGIQVRRAHWLSEPDLDRLPSHLGDDHPLSRARHEEGRWGRAVEREIRAVRELGGQVAFITGVREPIDRAIACLCETLPSTVAAFAELRAVGPGLVDLLVSGLTARLKPGACGAEDWFWRPSVDPHWFYGEELRRISGVDVLARPFDRVAGFTVVRDAGQAVLIYRHEDAVRVFGPGVAVLTGHRDVVWTEAVHPEHTPSLRLARELRARLHVPEDVAAAIYDHDAHLHHFYPPDDVERFKRRWTSPPPAPTARPETEAPRPHATTSVVDDYLATPIFIVSYNRPSPLIKLLKWLDGAGHRNVFVLDNDSSYPPLLRYYEALARSSAGRVRVVRLGENHGKFALWHANVLDKVGVRSPFVYSDCDVIPDESCPADAVGHLASLLNRHPGLAKVGLGLRLDDLPVSYQYREQVLAWERRFWRRPVARGLFSAPVDTTFALYPADAAYALEPALRTGFPYRARHDSWYTDGSSEEQRFYAASVKAGTTHWSRGRLPPWFETWLAQPHVEDKQLLQLGCGHEVLPGWINVDVEPGVGPDIVFDLDACARQKLPLGDDSIDGFFMSHVFEHLDHTLPLMEELHRVAKPGAKLVLRLPHGGSDPAMEDPTHRRPYYPDSFLYFGQPAYSRADYGYRGDWQVQRVKLVVDPHRLAAEGEAAMRSLVATQRNLVAEMIVELVAVKPARPRELRLLHAPRPILTGTALDEDTAF